MHTKGEFVMSSLLHVNTSHTHNNAHTFICRIGGLEFSKNSSQEKLTRYMEENRSLMKELEKTRSNQERGLEEVNKLITKLTR